VTEGQGCDDGDNKAKGSDNKLQLLSVLLASGLQLVQEADGMHIGLVIWLFRVVKKPATLH